MAARLALSLLATFWLGMLVALAVEARVKFNAPSLTRAVGLDVGRHVFGVFARIEWLLAVALAVFVVMPGPDTSVFIPASVVIIVIFIQSFGLRPSLNERAATIIAGEEVPRSSVHLFYLVAELVKMLALIAVVAVGVVQS